MLGIHRFWFTGHWVFADVSVIICPRFVESGRHHIHRSPSEGKFRAVAFPHFKENRGPDQIKDSKDGLPVHALPGCDEVDDANESRRDEGNRVVAEEGKVQGDLLSEIVLNPV